jgi:hypothetical protein
MVGKEWQKVIIGVKFQKGRDLKNGAHMQIFAMTLISTFS